MGTLWPIINVPERSAVAGTDRARTPHGVGGWPVSTDKSVSVFRDRFKGLVRRRVVRWTSSKFLVFPGHLIRNKNHKGAEKGKRKDGRQGGGEGGK